MLNTTVKKVSTKGKFKISDKKLYFKDIKNTQYYKNIVNQILEDKKIPYVAKIQCGIIVLFAKGGLNQIKFYNIDYYDFNYRRFEIKKP